jgi:sortase A
MHQALSRKSRSAAGKPVAIDHILLLLGLVLLAVWGGAWAYRVAASRAALAKFQARDSETAHSSSKQMSETTSGSTVDFSLWSPKRVEAFKESLTEQAGEPLAVLRIPKIHLEVPVFSGTDDLTLNRGVGRILGTAQIGRRGNVGIAGHRDGFFRGLKDVAQGDIVELVAPGQTLSYVIDRIQIVNPDDVSVLHPTPNATLTLVTCYPFYFIGSAPQRYIVSASLKNLHGSNEVTNQISPSVEKITSQEE